MQLGVAVAGGADILVHTVQAALEQHPEWAYGTIDIANAYNEVSRAVIERELLAHFPDLWSFYKVCYGGAPDLVFGVWDEIRNTESGKCMHGPPKTAHWFLGYPALYPIPLP